MLKFAASSIHLRLLFTGLVILPLFLGVTAWLLDRAFGEYQLESQRESLRLQQLLLAKAADWDGRQWRVEGLDEPRLGLLNSGLYAFVLSSAGDILWHSPSAEQIGDIEEPLAAVLAMALEKRLLESAVGETRYALCRLDGDYLCQGTRVAWGSEGPESVFLVVENLSRVEAARSAYRWDLLWLSLAASALFLLAQSLLVRWGLAPLRSMASDVERLEQGEADSLKGEYPGELAPLTTNINLLLASEKQRRERVRNTMDRLTHVLKTPLMLLRNSDEQGPAYRELANEQVTRMLGIVEGELARAKLDGRGADILGRPIPVRPVLQRIVDAYARLPRRGAGADLAGVPDIDTSGVDDEAVFLGDERDLQDLFGTVLENSLKYCRQQVEITAATVPEAGREVLVLRIGDDGAGIPEGSEQEILQRGARADTVSPGQGLGLAIVIEIVSAYGGSLSTGHSALGGALFTIKLPGSRSHPD